MMESPGIAVMTVSSRDVRLPDTVGSLRLNGRTKHAAKRPRRRQHEANTDCHRLFRYRAGSL